MAAPKRRRWLILGFFLLICGGIVALVLSNGRKPIRVQIVRAKHGRVEEIVSANSVGTVEAQRTATVSAEISGRVREIAVRPGSKTGSAVGTDIAVVVIDDSDIVAEWKVTNTDIETQQLRAKQAAQRREKLQADYDRLSQTDEPRQTLDRLKKEIEIAQTDEQIAASAIKTLQAQLQVIERKKAKSSVPSPFAGTVSKLHVEIGEFVTPGKPLFTVLSDGPLLVRAPIDEVDKARVTRDRRARVMFDGFREKFDGSIVEIMNTASTDQKNNRTIDIKIQLDAMPPQICAGMSAHVEIVVESKERGLHVPTHLVHEERGSGAKFVYLVRDGRARKRPVKTGLSNWETTEIVDGLSETDDIVNPLKLTEDQSIEDGTAVEVVP